MGQIVAQGAANLSGIYLKDLSQNANLYLGLFTNIFYFFNITYITIQPQAEAIYEDSNGMYFEILSVNPSNYTVAGSQAPALGTLTKISGVGDASVTLNSYSVQTTTYGELNQIVLENLIEPTATSYSRIKLIPANWTVLGNVASYPSQAFTVALQPFGTMGGCFIASTPDMSGVLVVIDLFSPTISLINSGDTVNIAPTFNII